MTKIVGFQGCTRVMRAIACFIILLITDTKVGSPWHEAIAQEIRSVSCQNPEFNAIISMNGPGSVRVNIRRSQWTFIQGHRDLLTVDFVRVSKDFIDVGSTNLALGVPAIEFKVNLHTMVLSGVFEKGTFSGRCRPL